MTLQITINSRLNNNTVEFRDVEHFDINAAELTIFFRKYNTYTKKEFVNLINSFNCPANYYFNELPWSTSCLLGIGVDNMKNLTFNIL